MNMAVFNLSAIISKFLKRITLSELEQEQIRDEIGAVGVTEATYGGGGDANADMLAKFGANGRFAASHSIYMSGPSGSGTEADIYYSVGDSGYNQLRITSHRLGSFTELIFPDALSAAEIKLPDYSCTLVGGDPTTGLITKDNVDQIFQTLEVPNTSARYALGVEQARNKIVIDYSNIFLPYMYVLAPEAGATSSDTDWILLGRVHDASLGGQGAQDAYKSATYGSSGRLDATYEVKVTSLGQPGAYIKFSMIDYTGNIWSAGQTYSGNMVFPGNLTANRTWTLPDLSGTLLTDGNAVTLSTVQTITGGKTFSGPVNFGDDVAFTDSTVTFVVAPAATFNNNVEMNGTNNLMPNQVASDDDSVMTRLLCDTRYGSPPFLFEQIVADGTPVTSSTALVDSLLTIDLPEGIWEVSLWAPFTTAATPGAKAALTFTGTITPIGGYAEVGSNAAAPVRTQVIATTGNEGYNGAMSSTGQSTAHFATKVIYEVTTTGTLTLQYAQQVSNASATTLKSGAYFKAQKVADLPPP